MLDWCRYRLPLVAVAAALLMATGAISACVDDTSGANDNQENSNQNTDPNQNDDEVSPSYETYFTQPISGEPDETIESAILSVLESAPDDAVVRAAFYTFGRDSVAEAFGDAHDRGVDIRVILGNTSTHSSGNDWSAVTILRERLGERLTICRDGESEGGCMGDNIHHNKFVTVSELDDGSQHVSLKTSANLTDFQLNQFNNLLMIRDDKAIYDAFLSYWDDLRRDETDLDYDRVEQGDGDSTVYFFPLSSGDPVWDALQRVDCETGADIHVAMAFFTNSRSDIAEQLRAMDEQGCGIHLVLRERPQINSPGIQIMGNLENGDIEIGLFRDGRDVQLHSKYLLIAGAYDGVPDARVVWTGSHNFTISALRFNDETAIKVRDEAVYDAFFDDWTKMRDQAELVHPE